MPFSSDPRFRVHLVDAAVATLLIPVLVTLLWMAFQVTDAVPPDASPTELMLLRGAVRTPFIFCLTCVFFRAFTAWEDVLRFLAQELHSRTGMQRQARMRKE
ncbi:hypothetical protein KH5H1_59280 [Corallococcus caeni]|uniref:hypothetical protein n=1 Tax=Corallococcus caeni TaxID=3082388 RepID=UPI00295763BE|nr:hypothetical protein KH5H1_59280 [Corallococcus sp. KH5-1]